MAEEPQLIQVQPVMIHPKQMAILRNCMQAQLGCTKLMKDATRLKTLHNPHFDQIL